MPQGGLPSIGALAAARRADRLRVKAHVGGPGAARRCPARGRRREPVCWRTSAPIVEPARTGASARIEDFRGSDEDGVALELKDEPRRAAATRALLPKAPERQLPKRRKAHVSAVDATHRMDRKGAA